MAAVHIERVFKVGLKCVDAWDSRFEKEVLGGRLWHPACQQLAGDISEEIPLQVSWLGFQKKSFDLTCHPNPNI